MEGQGREYGSCPSFFVFLKADTLREKQKKRKKNAACCSFHFFSCVYIMKGFSKTDDDGCKQKRL